MGMRDWKERRTEGWEGWKEGGKRKVGGNEGRKAAMKEGWNEGRKK